MTPYVFNLSHDPEELNQFQGALGGGKEELRIQLEML